MEHQVHYVDEEVTRRKFKLELENFDRLKEHYRQLGILLLHQNFPDLYFAFLAPAIQPTPIVFAVRINFTNYDVEPLSVKFVHPLTFQPLKINQLMAGLLRRLKDSPVPQNLLVADQDGEPFFCIPGVREYHNHPFHNGDSWFLYRKNGGEGSLCFLIDNLQLYGTSHVVTYNFQINMTLGSNPNLLPL